MGFGWVGWVVGWREGDLVVNVGCTSVSGVCALSPVAGTNESRSGR